MFRATYAFAVLTCLVPLPLFSQEPGDLSAELDKAKAEYQAAKSKAKTALLEAFASEEKKTADSTQIKPEERVKLISQLRDQKAAFEVSGKSPSVPGLAGAYRAYGASLSSARKACENAFDAAANGYLAKNQLEVAKKVLEEKAKYFEGVPDFEAETKREYWVYDFPNRKEKDLWFKWVSRGEWVERSGDKGGTLFKFRETGRTADYVELFDRTRQVSARLYLDRVEMKEKDGAGWKFLAKGSWQTLPK